METLWRRSRKRSGVCWTASSVRLRVFAANVQSGSSDTLHPSFADQINLSAIYARVLLNTVTEKPIEACNMILVSLPVFGL
jgi:hypothetical protein